MGSKKRQSGTSLKELLLNEFYSFNFFQAVNLLETICQDKKPIGDTLSPENEAVRFSVKPGFTFPASDISNVEHPDTEKPITMDVTFMGLIGPNGELPEWYNELAMNRNRQKDFSFSAFLDIFHHRLISLFYLAWKKHRFPENYIQGARDKLSGYLLSLAGLGTSGLKGTIGIPKESLPFFCGFLSNPITSAAAIKSVVEYFAGAHVEIEQFVERLLPFAKEDQTQLGIVNIQLGIDVVCGDHVWENQSKFRIKIGPLDYHDYLGFLPTRDLLGSIFSFIRYLIGVEYEFEIRIYLNKIQIICVVLVGKKRKNHLC